MAAIFAFSTGLGTAEHTIGLLQRLVEAWSPEAARHFTPVQLEYLNYLIRKLAHVTEYAILTLLAFRAFQHGRPNLQWKAALGALTLSIAYAATDELHQAMVPYRTASVRDVLIDSLGAAIVAGLAATWFWVKAFERKALGVERAN
jgi:VanZ family protein